MAAMWISVIAVLGSLNLLQLILRHKRSKELVEVTQRLGALLDRHSPEALLLMTDDRELQQLLIQLNRLLKEQRSTALQFVTTEQRIKRLLANFSHDLKTPMTVVLGYAELLQTRGAADEREHARLHRLIHEKTLDMLGLVNDFFNLARLEAGDAELSLSRVNISELCRRSLLSYYELAQESGFQVEIRIPESSIYVSGNEQALERVLGNLLSNALRHGIDGKTLTFELVPHGKQVRLHISDSGKGIEPRHQPFVFDRLFTVEESRSKAFQGSGLGLAITKKLVEQMDGHINLDSVPFDKTTFTVTLNRAE